MNKLKPIVLVMIVVVLMFLLNGIYIANRHVSGDFSMREVANDYESMNPISRYSYEWMMKDDMDVINRVVKDNIRERNK